jgi:hypothetical protein
VKENKNGRSQNGSEFLETEAFSAHSGRHPLGAQGSCWMMGPWALHSVSLPHLLPPEFNQVSLLSLLPVLMGPVLFVKQNLVLSPYTQLTL